MAPKRAAAPREELVQLQKEPDQPQRFRFSSKKEPEDRLQKEPLLQKEPERLRRGAGSVSQGASAPKRSWYSSKRSLSSSKRSWISSKKELDARLQKEPLLQKEPERLRRGAGSVPQGTSAPKGSRYISKRSLSSSKGAGSAQRGAGLAPRRSQCSSNQGSRFSSKKGSLCFEGARTAP